MSRTRSHPSSVSWTAASPLVGSTVTVLSRRPPLFRNISSPSRRTSAGLGFEKSWSRTANPIDWASSSRSRPATVMSRSGRYEFRRRSGQYWLRCTCTSTRRPNGKTATPVARRPSLRTFSPGELLGQSQELPRVATEDPLQVGPGKVEPFDQPDAVRDRADRPIRPIEHLSHVADGQDGVMQSGPHPPNLRVVPLGERVQQPGGVRVDVLVLVRDLGRLLHPRIPDMAQHEADRAPLYSDLIEKDRPGVPDQPVRVRRISLVDPHGNPLPLGPAIDGLEPGVGHVEGDVPWIELDPAQRGTVPGPQLDRV